MARIKRRRSNPRKRTSSTSKPKVVSRRQRETRRVLAASKRGGGITLRSSFGKVRSGRVQRKTLVKTKGFGRGFVSTVGRTSGKVVGGRKITRKVTSIRATQGFSTKQKSSSDRRFVSPIKRTTRVGGLTGKNVKKPRRSSINKRRVNIGSGPIPPRTQPPLAKVEFGFGGGSAINNVFGLIQQTSQKNADRKAQLKAEGRLPAQQPRREPLINIEELFGFDF